MTQRRSHRRPEIPPPPLIDRVQARRACLSTRSGRILRLPEPRFFGSVARGAELVAGSFLFAGTLVEAPDKSPWDIAPPSRAFANALHGFGWLDDLAALGGARARARARDWTLGWIARHGRGGGPGWRPELAGRRLRAWVAHGQFLAPRDPDSGQRIATAMLRHATYLARRWTAAPAGPDRLDALAGLAAAGLVLEDGARFTGPALEGLAAFCTREIDAGGGIATRNPETLMEVFATLVWIADLLGEAGHRTGPPLPDAILRIAPTLRALRHADGGLARFHGGGRGATGRLDRALATARIRGGPRSDGPSMGYARLSGGRTTVIVDAAAPPAGAAAATAHASTLALELTSGRRPVIVNCGSGAAFGAAWHRAGRATPNHSTLGIDGVSSARFGGVASRRVPDSAAEALADPPRDVRLQQNRGAQASNLMVGHDGYVATHGLTHVRRLSLSRDGRSLSGQDTLGAMTEPERATFEARLMQAIRAGGEGVDFSVRFHLHPDVEAELSENGEAVTLTLLSGERWRFAHDGAGMLAVEPSVYLEPARLRPLGTAQIVVSASVVDYAAQIGWTLEKAEDTPRAIRDVAAAEEESGAPYR